MTRFVGTIVLTIALIAAYFTFRNTQPWASGALVLIIAYSVYVVIAEKLNPFLLALGTDNRYSLSKLQFFLWTLAIGFGVAALLAKHAFQITDAIWRPNLFIALGFSSLTVISAKAITTRQVANGETVKTPGTPDFRQFLLDDGGRPDLTKFQMLFWTIVAILAFVGQLPATIDRKELPEISALFLVLMGLADGTYLGTKLVTTDTPRLTGIAPGEAMFGTKVTVHGAAFGSVQSGSQILVGGVPVVTPPLLWTDIRVEFLVPRDRMGNLDVQLVVAGRHTNAIPLNVVPLRIDGLSPGTARAGSPVDIIGTGFGDVVADIDVLVGTATVKPTQAAQRTIRFAVPQVAAGDHNVQVKRAGEISNAFVLKVG
jgi:hypothetical protein